MGKSVKARRSDSGTSNWSGDRSENGKPARAKGNEASDAAMARVLAVMKAAEHSGLLDDKSTQISVRISLALVEQAKKRTGIKSDTQLIEFALASLALEDDFGRALLKRRGTLDPDLQLGF